MLFHNDGAKDIPKHGLPRIEGTQQLQNTQEKEVTDSCGEGEIIKSNIVMFEFRDQISNLTEEDIGPFASFFENDYDFLEQVICFIPILQY